MHGFFLSRWCDVHEAIYQNCKIHGLWVRLLDFGAGPTRMPQSTMTNVEIREKHIRLFV